MSLGFTYGDIWHQSQYFLVCSLTFLPITVFCFRSTQQQRPFKLESRVQQFIALWRAKLTSESHSFTKTPPLFSISYTRISVHTTERERERERERESHTQPTKPINNKYLFSSHLSLCVKHSLFHFLDNLFERSQHAVPYILILILFESQCFLIWVSNISPSDHSFFH